MSKRSLPWLQFFPADWLSDSVAGCSLAAQGLWFRMLCVAHTSQRYGYLEMDGKPIPDELMFRRCGCASVEEYRTLLAELFAAGVPSRTPEGIIYSRRMVRDQQERDSAAERQRRHRCHAPVTPMSQGELRDQKTEVISQRSEKEKNAAAPPTPWAPGVCDQLFDLWNENRGPLPQALKLTRGRRDKILARIKTDPSFPETFKAAVLKARQTPFCSGAGERGWKANFDWLIANETNAVRILEGAYDGGKGRSRNGKPTVGDNMRQTLEAYGATEQKAVN